jgi:hypothetical protein
MLTWSRKIGAAREQAGRERDSDMPDSSAYDGTADDDDEDML